MDLYDHFNWLGLIPTESDRLIWLEPSRDSAVSYSVVLVAEGSRVRGAGSFNAVMWRLVHASIKWEPDRTWRICVWVTLCAFNGSMRCMLRWELRYVLAWSKSESGIKKILYSASKQGYQALALYKYALLLTGSRMCVFSFFYDFCPGFYHDRSLFSVFTYLWHRDYVLYLWVLGTRYLVMDWLKHRRIVYLIVAHSGL